MRGQTAIQPTTEQLAPLSAFERGCFTLIDRLNRNPLTKSASAAFLRTVGAGWVSLCTRNLIHLVGLEQLQRVDHRRGLLLASNHRSFFDLYVTACWLYQHTDLLRRVYFPVRAEFFYEQPAGLIVNMLMAAGSMYPPIFRQANKRSFNTYGVRRVVELLQQPGSVVGMHPEGRRNKGPDPYDLLPAQPGIGKLVVDAQPSVVPVFINGLDNNLRRQISANFLKNGEPIIIVVGAPLELDQLLTAKLSSLRRQKSIADRIREAIIELSSYERALRQRLAEKSTSGPAHYALDELR
ncbi:MAG: 1-acyl-sn-glycerol-3-phosphate acyltransferase [Deltaproteobacteria bacterium]|nr:1-acyl-sn-glycerol-3-phosphate acyltransferase [Deltaproteobacteria bacterium]